MKKSIILFLLIAQPAFAAALPRPDHIVVVIEENKAYQQIIDNTAEAPYINALAGRGMLFTKAYAITHPSQPNYLALFAGSTYGVDSDACPQRLDGPNLADSLQNHGLSFAIYSEGLPGKGALDCSRGDYQRKHNPVANWKRLANDNLPLSALPKDFAKLPTVSWIIPNQQHDMHDGSIAQGDAWLKRHLSAYVDWAAHHNSMLIITWDEGNYWSGNHIATIFIGASIKHGRNVQQIDHYDVLRAIEQMYGLPLLDNTKQAHTLDGIGLEKGAGEGGPGD